MNFLGKCHCLLLAGTLASVATATEAWPQFRGLTGQGIASGSGPLRWGKDNGIAWEVTRRMPKTPSMIVTNGQILALDDTGTLTSLDAKSGKPAWNEKLGHPFPELFQRGLGFFHGMAEDDHVVGIPHKIVLPHAAAPGVSPHHFPRLACALMVAPSLRRGFRRRQGYGGQDGGVVPLDGARARVLNPLGCASLPIRRGTNSEPAECGLKTRAPFLTSCDPPPPGAIHSCFSLSKSSKSNSYGCFDLNSPG